MLIVATYNTLENWHKIINVVLMRFLFVSSLQVLQYIYIYIYMICKPIYYSAILPRRHYITALRGPLQWVIYWQM